MGGLREVTQDEQVFEGMHRDLVTVLALAERCLKEQVLSGQPLLSSVRGSGSTPLAVVRDIMGQVSETACRVLLYRLLSGQTIQGRSDERQLARATSHGLCVLLPHNLTTSSSQAPTSSRRGWDFRWRKGQPSHTSPASR